MARRYGGRGAEAADRFINPGLDVTTMSLQHMKLTRFTALRRWGGLLLAKRWQAMNKEANALVD